MESTSAYVISVVTALVFLLIAAIISTSIKYEGGSNPQDPKKRKKWFWILAIVTPAVTFLLGYFVFRPEGNVMIMNKYTTALGIGTGVSLIIYILMGFVLSKLFANGKIGNWF